MVIVGEWVRLLSTSHSPSLLPSSPPQLPPAAAAAAAALHHARTPQCKGCSNVTIGWQELVFRGQTTKFYDGYIVRLIPSSLRQGERIEQFKIFCRCRQSEIGRMIQCDSCHNWFHDICIETDLDRNSLVWIVYGFLINVSKSKKGTAPRRTGKAEETLLGRGNIDSRGRPCAVPQTVPSGPIFLPRMFWGDKFFCHGRSGETHCLGDQFSCDRTPLKTGKVQRRCDSTALINHEYAK